MLKTRKNQKGFTLTELIIVIVIIGILAAVLIPTLSSYVTRAKKSAAEQNAVTMYQEFVGREEFDEEELSELLVAKFHVYDQKTQYLVVIEKGAVVSSEKLANHESPTGTEKNVYVAATTVEEPTPREFNYDSSLDEIIYLNHNGSTFVSAKVYK